MHPDHILAAPAHPDPYPYYAALAAGPALVFDERHGFWMAAHPDVVRAILTSPACRVRPPAGPVPAAIAGSPAGEVFARLIRMNEGARHGPSRRVLQQVMGRADLARVRTRTAEIAGTPLTLGSCDGPALSQWTADVPVMAVADWLGFDAKALPEVAVWVADFVACLSPRSTTLQLDAASAAASALLARLEILVDQAAAGDGSTLALLKAEAAASGWQDRQALLANLVGLLSQTCEATAGLLGNSIVAITRRPGVVAELRGQPARLQAFVAFVSRHDPSIHNTRRFVSAPVDVAGQMLQAGDALLLVLAAGHPAPGSQPSAWWPDGTGAAPHAFGHGIHQCPGEALACTVAAAALACWLELLAGTGAAMPAGWTYRPLPNARIPVFQ